MQKSKNQYKGVWPSEKRRRYDLTYLKMAKTWADELSHCKRRKVGALIVRGDEIISQGHNGTPSGFDNCCETDDGKTKWYVLHAEANAILKKSRSAGGCEGATVYQTLSPCRDCSKMILRAGIRRVVYIEDYKDLDGVEFLKKAGVKVDKIEI